MSRIDSGILRWRSLATGAVDSGSWMTHERCDQHNRDTSPIKRHWIKGCACDDCEAARGANDDEAQQ